MMNPIPWIALSERAYRALLIVYPADYRREYGPWMAQMFRDVCRDAYQQQGAAGIVLWWCTTLFDLALTAFEQRRKGGFRMSKSMWIRLSGTLLILGGAFGSLAAFSQLQPDDHYRYYGIYQALMLLLAPGFLFTGLGCIGLALRYERTLGTVSQWALILSGVGALVMALGVTVTQIREEWWNIWYAGGVVHTLALTAFGLLHLRKPALPVFRGLPLQIAAGWLVMMLGVLRTDSQTANNALAFLIFVGMGLAWLGIGLAVQRQQPDAAPAVA
jgi:hypothetical protein